LPIIVRMKAALVHTKKPPTEPNKGRSTLNLHNHVVGRGCCGGVPTPPPKLLLQGCVA
jgi:hypothetical protein